MPRVFTVYNCGTGFDRTHTDELIGNLGIITLGVENRDWMITDGVGNNRAKFNRLTATPQQIGLHDAARLPGSRVARNATLHGQYSAHVALNSPGPGRLGRFTRGVGNAVRGTAGVLHLEKKHDSFMDAVTFRSINGTFTGHGWDDNVNHAMDVILALLQSDDPPEVINMAGWSRGAITCIMLAHALHNYPATQHLKVNIFAADPVAGPGNRQDIDKSQLPNTVVRYVGVMQRHEYRGLFNPNAISPLRLKIPHLGLDLKHQNLSMPGVHNTGVMMNDSSIGLITASIAHHFLIKHGTQLQDPICLFPRQICELYSKVRLHNWKYVLKAINAQCLLGKHNRKEVRYQAQDWAATEDKVDYFYNQHHIKQFGQAFPITCNRLLGKPFNLRQARLEQDSMSRLAPTTYRSLEKVEALC